MRCRRQAPTGRHANPTFAGWLRSRSGLAPPGAGKSAARDGARTERPDHDPRPPPDRRRQRRAAPSGGSPVSEGRWVHDEEVATMTGEEILAVYRQKRKNPYLTLSTGKALH